MLNPHKNGFLLTAVIFYTLFTFAGIGYSAGYGGGNGTLDDPYQIWTLVHIQTLASDYFSISTKKNYFKLMADHYCPVIS